MHFYFSEFKDTDVRPPPEKKQTGKYKEMEDFYFQWRFMTEKKKQWWMFRLWFQTETNCLEEDKEKCLNTQQDRKTSQELVWACRPKTAEQRQLQPAGDIQVGFNTI